MVNASEKKLSPVFFFFFFFFLCFVLIYIESLPNLVRQVAIVRVGSNPLLGI